MGLGRSWAISRHPSDDPLVHVDIGERELSLPTMMASQAACQAIAGEVGGFRFRTVVWTSVFTDLSLVFQKRTTPRPDQEAACGLRRFVQ
jgi:hypothetical protein